jgi:hypothetical protein
VINDMTALLLLVHLRRLGVRCYEDHGALRVVVPKDVFLPPEGKALIVRHKAEILHRLLSGDISTDDVLAMFPGSVVLMPEPPRSPDISRTPPPRNHKRQQRRGPESPTQSGFQW